MKSLTLCVALLLTFAAAACNTVKGVGQDMQKAGESIENAVKKK